MKTTLKNFLNTTAVVAMLFMVGCSNDDDGDGMMPPDGPQPTGMTKTYALGSVDDPDISGTATFSALDDGSVNIELALQNTESGAMYPAHIHFNTAAEGGDIALSLTSVSGDDGMSITNTTSLDNGTEVSYEDLLAFDGYINVHLSADDLGTLVAQGDIGQNELTGELKIYNLESVSNPDISGTATFEQRVNGEALATIELENTPTGVMHPGHIHFNTAAEGGDIAYTFASVNGDTGISKSNVAELDDGTAIGYEGVLEFDGYINIHFSADDLGTLIAQGDIGQNELTGESKTYDLESVSNPDISGTATFEQRINGEALATIELENTPTGVMHPGHIHFNTAAEGGDIAYTFASVNGDTGISKSNVAELDDGTAIGYEGVLEFDGYINIHFSADDLGTLIAQGDIGQNELTGENVDYDLASVSNASIFGTANFAERVNGETLVTIELEGTTAGGEHPAHIHMGSVAEAPGAILISLINVDGETGLSKTNVTALNGGDGTPGAGDPIDYESMIAIDGYINVHLSMADLATLIAQGDVGVNAESGSTDKTYDVTNNGTTSYVFNGEGLTNEENPNLTLVRGETYIFNIAASGHPFYIKSVQGNTTSDAYGNGVTGNGTENGAVTFTVPMDAPDTLYYNCQFHSSMTGTLNIID